MSCLPHLNVSVYTRPLPCARTWLQGDYSFYEGVAYSMVPLYFYPRAPSSVLGIYHPVTLDPSNAFVVAPPLSPVAYDHGQRECYYRHATTAMNASGIQVLEKPDATCSLPGDRAIVQSSQSSNSFEKSRSDEVMLKLIDSSDHSDARKTEERGSGAEKVYCESKISNVSQESKYAEKIASISSELQVETNCSISGQSCYLSALDLKMPEENVSLFSSSFDNDLDTACKEQQRDSTTMKDTSETNTNSEKGCTIIQFKDNLNDYHQYSGLDDDSQLEYLSAEEHEYVDQSFSSGQETSSSESLEGKELVSEDESIDGQQFSKKQDYESSVCSSVSDCYNYTEIPEFLQIYQDDQEDKCWNFEEHYRQQTVSMFHSILNEDPCGAKAAESKNSKSFSKSKADTDNKAEAVSLTNIVMASDMAVHKEFSQTNSRNTNVLQKSSNLYVLQENTVSPHKHGDSEVSDACVYEQCVSIINTNKEDCSHGSHGRRCQENFPNSELECIPYLDNIASKVNQAVDASSDFRACFTTSRATNVSASVVTRAQNTVITMMNKGRPKEWMATSYRSVACNTDWSCMCGNVAITASQTAMTDMLENCIACEMAKCGWQSKIEDHTELNVDLDEIPKRMDRLSQERTSHLPNCCKELLQRAISAEMQLLRIQYQMHHQHYQQACKPVMEEKEYSSALETGKSLLQASLPQDTEFSSLPLVTPQTRVGENSDCQLCLPNKEKKDELVEISSLNTQEEHWSDAKENLIVTESLTENEENKSVLTGQAETQPAEDAKESNSFYCVRVGCLSSSVSEVDLWLHFQKYHVSEISICEYSDNQRYATLGFKAACDAKLAVKEMNGREIKEKAVKVQLVKTVSENGFLYCWSSVKQAHGKRRSSYSCEKNIENKNYNEISKASASVLAVDAFISPLKGLDVPKGSLKSPLPSLALENVPKSTSASSKAPNSDFQFSETSSRNELLEIDQEEIAEGLLPQGSVQFTPNPSAIYVPPNTLNLRSFRKVVKRLEELHPEADRNNILDALVEMKESKGALSGLPLSTIVQMTSSLLNKKYDPHLRKRQ